MERNKVQAFVDRVWTRAAHYLREWPGHRARIVHDEILRGMSYKVGSGAVSLIVIWIQTRR